VLYWFPEAATLLAMKARLMEAEKMMARKYDLVQRTVPVNWCGFFVVVAAFLAGCCIPSPVEMEAADRCEWACRGAGYMGNVMPETRASFHPKSVVDPGFTEPGLERCGCWILTPCDLQCQEAGFAGGTYPDSPMWPMLQATRVETVVVSSVKEADCHCLVDPNHQ